MPRQKKTQTWMAWMEEELRPGLGVCLIAFSLPLLVPGVTLTAVAFEDETGFAKYSPLHILGMVLLATALILFVAGILLHAKLRSKVSPDQRMSTHEKPSSLPTPPSLIESGHSCSDPQTTFAPTVGGCVATSRGRDNPALTLEGRDSSSSCDDDSELSSWEDVSSASYVLRDPSSHSQSGESRPTSSRSSHDNILLAGSLRALDLRPRTLDPIPPRDLRLPSLRQSFPFSGHENATMRQDSVKEKHFSFGSATGVNFFYDEPNSPPKFGVAGSVSQNVKARQRLQALRSDTPSDLTQVQSGDLTSDLKDRCDSNVSVFIKDEKSGAPTLVPDLRASQSPRAIVAQPSAVTVVKPSGPSIDRTQDLSETATSPDIVTQTADVTMTQSHDLSETETPAGHITPQNEGEITQPPDVPARLPPNIRWSLPTVPPTLTHNTGVVARARSVGQEHTASLSIISR